MNNKIAKQFLNKIHLQGYLKSEINIALFDGEDIVGIMTFGKPRYNKNFEWELLRYCCDGNVVGGAEKMFKAFIKAYSPKSIISYCDKSKFTGNVYRKLGFSLANENTQPSKHWYNIKTKQHFTNNLLLKLGADKLIGTNFGKGTDNEQIMKGYGFVEIYDCGQEPYAWYEE